MIPPNKSAITPSVWKEAVLDLFEEAEFNNELLAAIKRYFSREDPIAKQSSWDFIEHVTRAKIAVRAHEILETKFNPDDKKASYAV